MLISKYSAPDFDPYGDKKPAEPDALWPAPTAAGPLRARLALPGSKSITNRELVLAALADAPSLLRAPLHSRDSANMIAALRALGHPCGTLHPLVALADLELDTRGNTELGPYKSTNYDFSAEWYFSENSVLAAELFFRRISGYILNTQVLETHYNLTNARDDVYQMQVPINAGVAKVKGASLTYQQNFGLGFGMLANYTYSDADTSNDFPLPYNSKNSFNLSPFFEQGPWSARVTYSWRSSYFTSIAALQTQQITGIFRELDASVGYQVNDHMRISLDGTNLLDETYQVYDDRPSQPLYSYKNGRTYTLTLGFKL